MKPASNFDVWWGSFKLIVKFLVLLFVVYLGRRVAKITGHWEYGVLTFMITGYLSYLTEIKREVTRSNNPGLYNSL